MWTQSGSCALGGPNLGPVMLCELSLGLVTLCGPSLGPLSLPTLYLETARYISMPRQGSKVRTSADISYVRISDCGEQYLRYHHRSKYESGHVYMYGMVHAHSALSHH